MYTKNCSYAKRDGLWEVKETATDQVLERFATHDLAAKSARFINRGGAFAGWTPSFMLISCALDETADAKLSEFFA